MPIGRSALRASASWSVSSVNSSSPEVATGTGLSSVPAQLAILVVDDQRRCLEANLAACRLLGLPRRAALGRMVDDFLVTGMRKRLDHVWRAFREGGGHAGPFELSSQAAESPEVNISVVANVLPGRHLLILSATRSGPVEAEEAAARAPAAPSPAAGVVNSSGPRFGRGGPTAREREVLALLAAGATDEQIAEMLELSPATVQTHVRNAKAKLGARTRAQAVAMALQHGMISPT
jgi:DNA-binding CsgD family transcriptional regulator